MNSFHDMSDEQLDLYIEMMDAVMDTLMVFADTSGISRKSMIIKFASELLMIGSIPD